MRLTRMATMAVLAVTILGGGLLLANHAWNGYHWARTSNPFTLKLGDNVSGPKIAPGDWDAALNTASQDWSQSSVLNTVVVPGQSNPRNCRPTSGRVEVCNSTYGNTGWLGVAQIWVSGGTHITQGTVKLNDTYFNTATYNTVAWRQMVMCQEIGHTFGLSHQDEDFDNPNLGSCMDYTSNPGTNQHPNQHDFGQLETIYNSHVDSTTTIQSSSGASNVNLEQPSQWGQLMKSTRGGRMQVFARDLGNGEQIVTFVIWA